MLKKSVEARLTFYPRKRFHDSAVINGVRQFKMLCYYIKHRSHKSLYRDQIQCSNLATFRPFDMKLTWRQHKKPAHTGTSRIKKGVDENLFKEFGTATCLGRARL